jgi:hypothetical protein
MNQIPPYRVWVGHAGDGRSFKELLDRGIQAIVQLAMEEPVYLEPRELIYCRFPLVDGEGNAPALLDLAIRSVMNLLESDIPTLVCCDGGMSRAPAIVAAALALFRQADLAESLSAVTRHHPADVSPALWSEICRAAAKVDRAGIEPAT